MAYPIEKKLVIGVSSSALFKLDEGDRIYREQGIVAYRIYQQEHENDVLSPGVAYSFVRRFLKLNELFPEEQPVEVVLLSRNSPDTGLRVFNSIKHYDLNITRAAFVSGQEPFPYIPAYNLSLFLSAKLEDVQGAAACGFAAGQVMESNIDYNDDEAGLRIAFDFDGVIVDDSAEKIYKSAGMKEFQRQEKEKSEIPMQQGPLGNLFRSLGMLSRLEADRRSADPKYRKYIDIAIVTARNAPAHERVVNTLRNWQIEVDETFFLGGIDKGRVLKVLRPHIFFDDQEHPHLDSSKEFTPSVYIPLVRKDHI